VFQTTPQRLKKPRRRCAIDDAMIEGQTERQQVARNEAIALHSRFADDAADAKHGTLRQMNNRCEGVDAESAQVCDGEGCIAHLLRGQPSGTSLLDQRAGLGCDLAQGFHLARPMPPLDVAGWIAAWDPSVAARAPNRRLRPRTAIIGATARRVLVADDEPAIVEMIRDILEEYGFRVVTAANGAEALRLVDEAAPDVVLLDMNMPVLDGEGFVAAVRERGLRIPIVIMTAGSSAKRWATQLGADGYLSKPFDLSNLIDVTSRLAATL